jgi:peptidoglycan/LPS O-acetylase OafA/YrhL
MGQPPAGGESSPTSKPERRYDIDWLRVLAVGLLVVFHCTRPFDSEPWHARNDESSLALERGADFLRFWRMPLLFLVSGFGTYLALGFRSGARYARDRFLRLFVPLVVGMAVVVPPQVYVERISPWMPDRQSPIDFVGSYLEFYPHAFQGIYPRGNLSWHHLWFLAYLFVFSLAALPLFLWLRGPAGRPTLDGAGAFLARGRAIFLLGVPLALVEIALRAHWPTTHALYNDWGNFIHSFVLFLYGYLLAAYPGFRAALERNRLPALLLSGSTAAVLLARVPLRDLFGGAWLPGYLARQTLAAFNEWFWILAVLGYGLAWLERPSPVLRYATEIVYPFYIWHQTVIVVLAYFILRWPAGVPVKFVALTGASLAVTLLMCELVKLTGPTRFLFGMKPRVVATRGS